MRIFTCLFLLCSVDGRLVYLRLPLDADEPKVAPVLQPFVDSHSLAGAVTLVANKERILESGGDGWLGGHCRQETHDGRYAVLDRIHVQAHNGNSADYADR